MYIPSDYSASPLVTAYSASGERVRARREQEGGAGVSPEQGPDTVTVSSDARLVARLTETAQAAPDVRADKVAALKAQVDSGAYVLDNAAIAQAMLREDMRIFG